MATKIIVSYDGTDNDRDALALGRLLAGAGASLELAYVRHAHEAESGRERLAEQRGQGAPGSGRRRARPARHSRATSCSAAPRRRGCATLAVAEQADVIVFGSEYRTAPGHVDPQASARRLLDGGPVALALAPAGFAELPDYTVETVGAVGEEGDPCARRDGRDARVSPRRHGGPARDRRRGPRRRRLQAGHRERPGHDQRGRRVPDRAHALSRARPPPRRRPGVRLSDAGRGRAPARAGSARATAGSSGSSSAPRSSARRSAFSSARPARRRLRPPRAASRPCAPR